MTTSIIARVNNVDIMSISDERLVPIKPICEALGIDSEAQRQKIQSHYLLAPTALLCKAVGADGKQREMFCLPMEYIFGWLLTINPANVVEEKRQNLMAYQTECYKVLFEHFSDAKTFLKQKQAIIEKKVMEYQDCQRRFKDARKLMNKAKAELNQVMKYTIEDWRENNRQLNLPFAI
nr:MAG: hypothetical protein [Bacteriophage sp.]UWF99753.1 MAG: hypothetical protein [Bacteriophage sp.]UWH98606.1 MAG: hypothetical protein [Bacteriophage sp.]